MYSNTEYHSDHTPRTAAANKDGQEITVETLNLLKFCYSKKNGKWGYSNNPLNADETKEEYLARKRVQISLIAEASSDFYLLQELDFPFSEEEESLTLTKEFREALERNNKALLTYQAREIGIVYSKEYLLEEQQTFLKTTNKWQDVDALLTGVFTKEGKTYMVGSFHGDFGQDYSETMPALLSSLEDKCDFVIFGGDANHPPDYQMSGFLVSDKNDCTNYFSNYDGKEEGINYILLTDEPRSLYMKAYDGFFASKGLTVTVTGELSWEMGEPVKLVEKHTQTIYKL